MRAAIVRSGAAARCEKGSQAPAFSQLYFTHRSQSQQTMAGQGSLRLQRALMGARQALKEGQVRAAHNSMRTTLVGVRVNAQMYRWQRACLLPPPPRCRPAAAHPAARPHPAATPNSAAKACPGACSRCPEARPRQFAGPVCRWPGAERAGRCCRCRRCFPARGGAHERRSTRQPRAPAAHGGCRQSAARVRNRAAV